MQAYLSRPAVLCSAGNGAAAFFDALVAGDRSGLVRVSCGTDGDGNERSFWAGQIAQGVLRPTGDKYDMRVLQILDGALAQLAPVVSAAMARYGADRIGVCLGQCDNGSARSFEGHRALWTDGAFPAGYELAVQGADYPAAFAARKFGVTGVSLSFATACSSSATALVTARQLIRAGVCDAVIAGGVDIASPTTLLGFDSLEAISPEKTNPFSANRAGITLGEGAAFFVVSKDDLDGTDIVLAGAGESSDASHMTAPLADGSGAAQAMRAALDDAGIVADDIDYVNLHGTGTKLNDSMEAKAVDAVFASRAVPVSSTKAITGHTLGAAGALELAACFLAIQRQRLPVHVWDGVFADDIPRLNFVADTRPQRHIACCMSNSFAFGGCNVSLIIKTCRTKGCSTSSSVCSMSGKVRSTSSKVCSTSSDVCSTSSKVRSTSGDVCSTSSKVRSMSSDVCSTSGKVCSMSGKSRSMSSDVCSMSGNASLPCGTVEN